MKADNRSPQFHPMHFMFYSSFYFYFASIIFPELIAALVSTWIRHEYDTFSLYLAWSHILTCPEGMYVSSWTKFYLSGIFFLFIVQLQEFPLPFIQFNFKTRERANTWIILFLSWFFKGTGLNMMSFWNH